MNMNFSNMLLKCLLQFAIGVIIIVAIAAFAHRPASAQHRPSPPPPIVIDPPITIKWFDGSQQQTRVISTFSYVQDPATGQTVGGLMFFIDPLTHRQRIITPLEIAWQ